MDIDNLEIVVICRRRIYFWYRFIQLQMWDVFRPYDAYDLQEFILDEIKKDTNKYFKISTKERPSSR